MNVKEIISRRSRRHKARGRGQGHKTIRGQGPTLSRPRTGMLEAKAKDTTRKCFSKKKVLLNLPRGLWRVLQDEEKKRSWPWPIYTNQEIELSSTANRAFSRTCKLGGQGQGLYYRGQGLYYRGQGQGLQNMFSRTSSRIPPLKNSNAIQDKINVFFLSHRKICTVFA